MSARGNTIAQGFSTKVMQWMYDVSLIDHIVNRDYQGEINGVGSVLNILDLDKLSEKTYSGSNLTADTLTENNGKLIIDQYKSFYWAEKTLDNWLSYVKDPHPTIITQVGSERARNMDLFVFGLYTKIGAGNRVGTDYTTGTVQIDASGNVSGSGTTFTAAMVGRGFKATGHTKWYRVKTFTNTSSIVIEDDLDDVASQYTGGVISGGTAHTIEANTPVNITTSNLLQQVAALKLKLNKAEANGYLAVPAEGRFLIVPPEFNDVLVRAGGVVLHVPESFQDFVVKGFITMFQGFEVYESNRLAGDNTNGYRIIAGHKNWLTFAEKVLDARMEEDLIGNFGTAYKDLFVYGAKVKDQRRHQAAELFATFSV